MVLLVTFITLISQIYAEGLTWEDLNQNLYILLFILGAALIGSMFLYDLISYLLLRSEVHDLMDQTMQITPTEIARKLEEPLWRVLPIFRTHYDPGILINLSGNYIHFNEAFQEKFLEKYTKGLSLGDLAHQMNLSKKEITLIIDELDYKGTLPDVETPITPTRTSEREISTKGLRKTVRHRKKLRK